MKETLTFIGIIAFAVTLWVLTLSLWYLRGNSDKKIIDSNNVTIKSLQDTLQAKEDLSAKDKALLDAGNATIKSLQDSIQANAEKQKALLEAKDDSIKTLQADIQSKDDTVAKDKINLDAKDTVIKALQDNIAALQAQGVQALQENAANGNGDVVLEKIYPADNGFDAQDLGAGFFAYKVFGLIKNPNNVPFPEKVPNHTPWKFGDGNSGICANDSGMYLSGATNGDNDGAKSTNGQAGFLEYKDSSISQLVTLPAGTYTISFDFESRQNYAPNEIEVSIDGTALFQGSPTDTNNFKKVTTRSITLISKGKHELMFHALGSVGNVSPYPCTFIDNVCLNRIDPAKSGPDREVPGNNNNVTQLDGVPPSLQTFSGAGEDDAPILEKMYPKDNGFDAQDVGVGFSAFQYLGKTVFNPFSGLQPNKNLNHTPWKFNGNAGIAANVSWSIMGATNGDSSGVTSSSGQAGFLQYKESSISQSVTLPKGTYTVSFDCEGRSGYEPANQIAVTIDGTVVLQGAPTINNSFKRVTTRSFIVTETGKHELMFHGLGATGDENGDHTTFIDNVCINRIGPKKAGVNINGPFQNPPNPGAGEDAASVLEKIYPKDNGFDAQDLGAGPMAYQYFGKTVFNPVNAPQPDRIPNRTPWTFSGNAGIATNTSWSITGATNGDSDGATSTSGQAGFLQFKDSSISQSVTLSAGTYTVSFDYEGRRDYEPANQIAVSVDGTVLFSDAPTDTNNFKLVTTHSITLTKSGKHELMFRALGNGDASPYPTTFIDNVCLNRIDPKKAGLNKAVAPAPPKKGSDDIPDITEKAELDHSLAPAPGLSGPRIIQ